MLKIRRGLIGKVSWGRGEGRIQSGGRACINTSVKKQHSALKEPK